MRARATTAAAGWRRGGTSPRSSPAPALAALLTCAPPLITTPCFRRWRTCSACRGSEAPPAPARRRLRRSCARPGARNTGPSPRFPAVSLARRAGRLSLAQHRPEHPVDEPGRVGPAEALGRLDRFVDRPLGRDRLFAGDLVSVQQL